ncbi:MAG TPA: NADH-quinone oxidoreductase subunit L, partial [Thermoleophilia bacterium]|nr:NADH-quinone oxidoreductase subunit L [Thermoleophilia bacterium]
MTGVFALLWLLPALPAAGFVTLAVLNGQLGKRAVAWVGVGSVGLACAVARGAALHFWLAAPAGDVVRQRLYTWFDVGGLRPEFTLTLDAVSLVFVLVVTGVGFLIHLYSVEYMGHDKGFTRFFTYMNLFVAAMLLLVLADDLLLLFVGWEGVGLCSYLLIGFWYEDAQNGYAGRKAFIVTRIGDTALMVGLFLLFTEFGTLRISAVLEAAEAQWAAGSAVAVAAALLVLGGAVGKSAQLPLQTWLPDAMAGPTPVSALIHAATMVTAGVYLIARLHTLFELAPDVLLVVAVIGAATLLYAGFSALAQRDIKRVLAYSTISQIGYMFLALGVAAWSAAIFHFMTHAFFKALLFLAAGAVIEALDGEQDMFRMGGLRRRLPLAFWTFLIGAAALSALPLVTAGFYSKELILALTLESTAGGAWLWAAGIAGAFLTSLYSFRAVALVFFGEQRTAVVRTPGLAMAVPLVALGVLSVVGGFIELPRDWVHLELMSEFLHGVLPATELDEGGFGATVWPGLTAIAVSLLGIAVALEVFARRPRAAGRPLESRADAGLARFFLLGWGFDWVYDHLLVWPVRTFARVSAGDLVEPFVNGFAAL